jgi:iron complex transport system ATP-binding protein
MPAEENASTNDTSPPVLRVTSLSMWRDDTVLLRDVSWEVRRGEHWAVLGPNGSGKTSLLNALLGYEPASRGSVELLGERYGVSDWRALRRRIGVVSSALHVRLWDAEPAVRTVASGKFAAFGPWSQPDEADLTRARALLAAAGAAYIADRPWRVLSQGERQRVLIGRGLMAQPDLLLLDEACSGLDPVARERLLGVVEDLARTDRSVDDGGSAGSADSAGSAPKPPALVLVTHHVEEIVPAFTHVLLLREGRVVASGPKESVLTSELLGRAFDHPLTVRRRGERFELAIDAPVHDAGSAGSAPKPPARP